MCIFFSNYIEINLIICQIAVTVHNTYHYRKRDPGSCIYPITYRMYRCVTPGSFSTLIYNSIRIKYVKGLI